MSRIERLELINVEPWLSCHASVVAIRWRVVTRIASQDRAAFRRGSGAVVTRNLRARGATLLKLLVVVAVLMPVMSGCANSPYALALASDETIASTHSAHLAHAYNWDGNKRCRAELERRGVFTPADWTRIDNGEIRIGDTQLLVLAAWGSGLVVSKRVSAHGTVEVWDYGTVQYVTFRDGRVTAIHNYPY